MSSYRRYPVSSALSLKSVFSSLLFLVLSCALFGAWCGHAQASGTFIPATERKDMVHDAARGVLYITNGGSVLRYQLSTKSFLSPFELGGQLMGIDISPDGNLLAVADRTRSETQIWIHLVNLQTGVSTQALTARGWGEGGTFTVAFVNDGSIMVTGTYEGSGWVPLRRYYPATNTWSIITEGIRQDTMIRASADRTVVGFAESNISDGRFGRYRVSDGDLLRREWYDPVTGGTGWFNYEIAVNRNATQYAIPTYGGTFIYNADLLRIGTIGTYAAGQPIGVAYNPTADVVYFAWAGTTEIRAYNTDTLTQIATYNYENQFDHPGNHAFQEGRLRISNDGNYLFATVDGGVRYVSVGSNDEPVANAGPDQTLTASGLLTAVNLDGSASYDANGDTLTFTWREGNTVVATGATPTVNLTPGVHTLVLTVSDSLGASSQDTVVIAVNLPDNTYNAKVSGNGTLPDAAVASLMPQAKKPAGIQFRFSATNNKKGLKGSLSYSDTLHDKTITATDITNLIVNGKQATIFGVATVNGSGAYNFVLQVNDLPKKGPGGDTFTLSLSDGYTASSILKSGNITVQAK